MRFIRESFRGVAVAITVHCASVVGFLAGGRRTLPAVLAGFVVAFLLVYAVRFHYIVKHVIVQVEHYPTSLS